MGANTCAHHLPFVTALMQDKKWLAEALESLTVDEAKVMRDLSKILEKQETVSAQETSSGSGEPESSSATPAEKLGALEQLQDIVESLDNAKNLFVVGGYRPVLRVLASSNRADVRAAAATLVSTVVQNNPKAQQWALANGTLPTLAATLALASGDYARLLQDGGAALPKFEAPSNDDGESNLIMPTQLQRPAGSEDRWPVLLLRLWGSSLLALSSLVRESFTGQADLMASGAIAVLFAPLRMWQSLLLPAHAPVEGATIHGARVVRRCVFALRHLVEGTHAEDAKAALLAGGGAGLLNELVSLATLGSTAVEGGGGSGKEEEADQPLDASDVDVSFIRESALAVLLSLASPSPVGLKGAADEGDGRTIRVNPNRGEASDVPAEPAPPAPRARIQVAPTLAGNPPQITERTGAIVAVLDVPAAAQVAAPSVSEDRLPARLAVLRSPLQGHGNATSAALLAHHRTWCVQRAQAAASGALQDVDAAAMLAEATTAERALRRILQQ